MSRFVFENKKGEEIGVISGDCYNPNSVLCEIRFKLGGGT